MRPLPIAGRAMLLAALALPVAFLSSRSASEVLIAVIDALFLRRLASGPVARLPRALILATCLWWGWMIVASGRMLPAHGAHALVQAVLMGRFFLLSAALSTVLVPERSRAVLALVVSLAAAWIAVECWQQLLLGTDVFGWRRWGDGALTGPFKGPKAGPVLVLILFPALLPPVWALLRRPALASKAAAFALAAAGVATMVLIGQRMPALLTLLGLSCCAVLLRPLRPLLLATLLAAAALLALTPIVSPPTWGKLVVRFTEQMSHFPSSAYGQIYTRAVVMTLDHPWLGLGFDGFRAFCDQPRYVHGLPSLGIPDRLVSATVGCNIHPHNHYLEASTAGGLPGLALFCAAVLAVFAALGRGLIRQPTARRAGLFTALVIALWPFASTSAFFTLPNAGWTFLLLGWGLAEARAQPDASA